MRGPDTAQREDDEEGLHAALRGLRGSVGGTSGVTTLLSDIAHLAARAIPCVDGWRRDLRSATQMHVGIGVEVADSCGTGAVHVVDHDLGVELDDLDARAGGGVEVLGCELPVKSPDNQWNPGSFDDAG